MHHHGHPSVNVKHLHGIFFITSLGGLGLWVDGTEVQPATSLNALLVGGATGSVSLTIVVSSRDSSWVPFAQVVVPSAHIPGGSRRKRRTPFPSEAAMVR